MKNTFDPEAASYFMPPEAFYNYIYPESNVAIDQENYNPFANVASTPYGFSTGGNQLFLTPVEPKNDALQLRKQILKHAINELNDYLSSQGKIRVNGLPVGKRQMSASCPISKVIGEPFGGIINGKHYHAMMTFMNAFDAGAFPELDETLVNTSINENNLK